MLLRFIFGFTIFTVCFTSMHFSHADDKDAKVRPILPQIKEVLGYDNDFSPHSMKSSPKHKNISDVTKRMNSFASQFGPNVGGGGDALVCYKDERKIGEIQSVQVFDLFEGMKRRKFKLELGSKKKSVKENILLALNRIREINKEAAKKYWKRAKAFAENAFIEPGIDLPDILDEKYKFLPKNCKLKQVVVQEKPTFPEDKLYTVEKDLWDELNNLHKAALILHEVFYTDVLARAEDPEKVNSAGVRYFVSLLFTNGWGKYDAPFKRKLMEKIGLAVPSLGFILKSQGVRSGPNKPVKVALNFYEQQTDLTIKKFPILVKTPGGVIEIMSADSGLLEYNAEKNSAHMIRCNCSWRTRGQLTTKILGKKVNLAQVGKSRLDLEFLRTRWDRAELIEGLVAERSLKLGRSIIKSDGQFKMYFRREPYGGTSLYKIIGASACTPNRYNQCAMVQDPGFGLWPQVIVTSGHSESLQVSLGTTKITIKSSKNFSLDGGLRCSYFGFYDGGDNTVRRIIFYGDGQLQQGILKNKALLYKANGQGRVALPAGALIKLDHYGRVSIACDDKKIYDFRKVRKKNRRRGYWNWN